MIFFLYLTDKMGF